MVASTCHDAWQAGESYDAYMGRWSRPIASRFLDWLDLPEKLDWLEVGCGTGALTEAIVRQCAPAGVTAIDPSEGFISLARAKVGDPRVYFRIGDAASLARMSAVSRDVAVGGLVLNFIPDRVAALADVMRIVRRDGVVAFYVWDYPGGGIEFMRAFWTAAVELDPEVRDLTESGRFPFCTPEGLITLAREAGLRNPECCAIEVPSVFSDFEDYWRPFTLGTGPAPGYCAGLDPEQRERLRDKLSKMLPQREDGSIALNTRAWAVRAHV